MVFSGQSNRALAGQIAASLGIPLGKSTTQKFANDNLLVRFEESLREADVFIVQSLTPPVHDNLMELLMMVDAAKGSSANRVTAVIPYYSYARSDKKDAPRISIAGRLVADMLQTAGSDRVLTMTLHSSQVHGFFKIPLDHLSAEPVHIDELGAQVNMPMSQVSGTLALMELKGLVRQVGGMNYVAVREEQSDYSV